MWITLTWSAECGLGQLSFSSLFLQSSSSCIRAGAIAQRLWGLPEQFQSANFSSNNIRNNNNKTSGNRSDLPASPLPYHLLNQPQTIALDIFQTQRLYASLVKFRFYLVNKLGVSAANVVFHYPEKSEDFLTNSKTNQSLFKSSLSSRTWAPVQVDSEDEALR